MSIASRWYVGRIAAAGAVVLLLVVGLALPMGAWAATATQFTNAAVTSAPNQGDPSITYGGQPTRFTFSFTTASKVDSITAITLVFPKGTILTKSTADAVTLVGLNRHQVKVQQTIAGESIKLVLSPAIGSDSTARIRVYDAVPPVLGGTYHINGTWEGVGVSGTIPEMSYDQVLASPTVNIEDWLDKQPAVAAWNSVPLLNNFLKPQLLVRSVPFLFIGWLLSIALVAVSYPAAIPIGLALAFMKMSKIGIVRWIASAYINVIRGTPLFLQIFIAFFALPLAGIRAPEFFLGVVVLALNSSAYMAEIFRAGIQSINKGQFEAASSLGMTYAQAMAFVIIPQTVRRVLPTMTSEFILLFKDTALLSAVGVFELMKFAQDIAANTANVTPYLEAAAFYLILTIPLINYVGKLEARLALSEGGTGPSPRKPKRGAPAIEANEAAAAAAGNVPGE
jgi:polar amino acid transport system substrate-binding protein